MKRIISLILLAVLALSLVACGETPAPAENVKFGVAVVVDEVAGVSATDAKNGSVEAAYNVAVVLVDKDGKIVACKIDSIANTVNFTLTGEAVTAGEFKTKHELGAEYGMGGNAWAPDINGDGVVKEWNEQVDILCAAVVGKTIDEVKAMIAEEGRGNADLQTAGCTIAVAGYVTAIEEAVKNAKTEVAANATLSIGVVSEAEGTNATAEKNGKFEITSDVVGMAKVDGKVAASYTTSVVATAEFTNAGAYVNATTSDKRLAGDAYGMATNPYSADLNGDGTILEWYKQIEALEALYVGKTANEIKALALETGYGVDAVVNADCTINIAGYIAAAVKAAQ